MAAAQGSKWLVQLNHSEYSWPGLQWLLLVSKFWNLILWCPLSRRWITQGCNGNLAGRTNRI